MKLPKTCFMSPKNLLTMVHTHPHPRFIPNWMGEVEKIGRVGGGRGGGGGYVVEEVLA